MKKNYIITIGIEDYEKAYIDKLSPCCSNDCKRLVRALEDYHFESLEYKYFSKKPGAQEADLETRKAHLLNEEATLENITRLFENLTAHPDFQYIEKEDNTPAPPLHNLIIYYSGHGLTSEKSSMINFFNLVPYDYPLKLVENSLPKALYSLRFDLAKQLTQLRFHHLLIIIDACFSGGALNFADFFDASAKIKGYDQKEERSAWCITSSASNKLSFGAEQNSLFTGYLVDMLDKNPADELAADDLFQKLTKSANLIKQRPFYNRLGLVENNTGNFNFVCTDSRKQKNSLHAIMSSLEEGLPNYLNFSREKDLLKEKPGLIDSVIIFSNQKDSGLPFMMRSAFKDPLFAGYQKTRIIEEKTFNYAKDLEEKIHVFFQLSMGINVPDEETLIKTISFKLETGNRYIGVFFNEPGDGTKNLDLINELIRIVRRTHEYRKPKFKLYLYVLDEFKTDYTTLSLQKTEKLEPRVVTDKIAMGIKDIEEWYSAHIKSIPQETPKAVFIKGYLKEQIFNPLLDGFNEAPPATVIRSICEKGKCPGLADTLLTQIDDKSINYSE